MTVGDKISGFLCQWNNNRILIITSWKYRCLPKSLDALFQEECCCSHYHTYGLLI